jgi:hypothetical protein
MSTNLTLGETTFFAFRKKEKAFVLTGATIGYVLALVIVYGAFIALNWQGFADYMSWSISMASDPEAAAGGTMPPSSVMMMIPGYLVSMFLLILIMAAYEAACLRWMVRDQTTPGLNFLGIAFGPDTWRVLLVYITWIGVWIGLSIASLLLASGVAVAAGAIGDGAIAGLLSALVFIVLACAWVFVLVRLAPAAAVTIGKEQYAFFDAWRASQGRFWTIFGSFAFVIIMSIVGLLVFYFVAIVAVMGAVFGSAAAGAQPDPEAMAAAFTSPGAIIAMAGVYLILIALSMMVYVLFYGINARVALAANEDGIV